MRVPYSWLREYCAPDITLEELEQRLTLSGTKVEAIHHHGVGAAEGFVVGKVLSCGQHPDADRLNVSDGRRGRRRESAADRLRRAERRRRADRRGGAPGRDDARRHQAQEGQAARRRVAGDDPVRGRGRPRRATTRAGSWCSTTRWPPARRWSTCCRSSTRSSSSRSRPTGLIAWVSSGSRARSTPRPTRRWRPRRGPRIPARRATSRARTSAIEAPDLCPRFTARVFENVTIGPSPRWLKARLIAAGHAADQQRRRHHQLRDAAHGPSAARLRPRQGRRRRADGAAGERRRADRDARRPDADARRRDARHRGRRRADVDRRRHGRRALGGRGRHDARADGGRLLDRPQHPPHVQHRWACAARRPGASRRASRPSRRWRPRSSRPG